MRRNWLPAFVLALALALAACGGDTSVGEGLDLEGLSGNGDGPRLGERTAEPTEEPTSTPAPQPTAVETQQPQPTSEPTQVPTHEPTQVPTQEPTGPPEPQVALEVKIHSDTGGPSQFDPSLARIFANSCIRWTNVDSVERSVASDDGSFSSGPIAPGGEFVHCFDAPGKFNYHDGTRPYAVAAVEVLAS